MKRFGKLVGLVAMVAIMSFSLASCGDSGSGGGGTNYLNTLGLSTAAPTSEALSAGRLTLTQFEEIRELGAGGFQGWVIDDGELVMVWAGRNRSHFDDLVRYMPVGASRFSLQEGHSWLGWANEHPEGGNRRWYLEWFVTRFAEDGYFIPSGTLLLTIW